MTGKTGWSPSRSGSVWNDRGDRAASTDSAFSVAEPDTVCKPFDRLKWSYRHDPRNRYSLTLKSSEICSSRTIAAGTEGVARREPSSQGRALKVVDRSTIGTSDPQRLRSTAKYGTRHKQTFLAAQAQIKQGEAFRSQSNEAIFC
jgi:hypothetical protein